jgi:hypothetical protein
MPRSPARSARLENCCRHAPVGARPRAGAVCRGGDARGRRPGGGVPGHPLPFAESGSQGDHRQLGERLALLEGSGASHCRGTSAGQRRIGVGAARAEAGDNPCVAPPQDPLYMQRTPHQTAAVSLAGTTVGCQYSIRLSAGQAGTRLNTGDRHRGATAPTGGGGDQGRTLVAL